MNYLGVYRVGYARSHAGACDAPCVTKGGMALSAREMTSRGRWIAMVEGRIRNRRSLAAQLDCAPGTASSELILCAYEKWGEDYPFHVEGPALTCVMDAGADAMVLCRDAMGEQPVFYAGRGESIVFSDHPDTLLKYDGSLAAMDADGLRELFGLGPARTPGRTCYREVQSLEPGCALVVRDGHARLKRWFRIEDDAQADDQQQAIAHTRELLEQCVADTVGDHPAVMLSGGLDSTALTALLARNGTELLSFSVDYQNNAQDFRANAFRPEMDAPYVAEAVRAFGTQHRQVTLNQQDLAALLGRAVALRGFPGMADIDTSLLLFAREITRFGQEVVSGECGDEVFGGYPWFRGEAKLEGFPWSGSLQLRESLLRPELRKTLRIAEYVQDTFAARRAVNDPGGDFGPRERRLRTMQRLCFEYFMPNLQERALRMCEGAGLQVLTPLCDDRLVQYVYNVPWELKFLGGQEKGLLRAAVADLLPERLLRRTKSPYPKTCSPEYSRIVRGMALRMAMDPGAPIFDVIDRGRVKDLAESELNPVETPWFGQLMAGPQLLGYLWQVNHWMKERGIHIAIG